MDFAYLITRSELTKSQLARKLGVSVGTINGWADTPPDYAVAYLELLVDYRDLLIDDSFDFRRYSAELLGKERFYAENKYYILVDSVWTPE